MRMRVLCVGSFGAGFAEMCQSVQKNGVLLSHVQTIPLALTHLRAGRGADVILADLGVDVVALLHSLNQERIVMPVVVCGAPRDHEKAAKAIRQGAVEFLPMPPDPEMFRAVFESLQPQHSDQDMLFMDARMHDIVQLADQIAPSQANVLITGESGTGKEKMARYIHQKSKRADRLFVSINCAAIPDNLLESELFGYEKGAFTGAVARRIGKFEEAHGGTLLLDEIGEMDLRLQAKLLRAIQEKEIDRIGGQRPVKVDIRIIATTNRQLEHEVSQGRFREDLYYRLNVVNIELPPLRQRPKDIQVLAEHFVKRFVSMNDLPSKILTDQALEKLQTHLWKGNIRELENTLHRAVLLSKGDRLQEDDIVLKSPQHDNKTPLSLRTLAEVERDHIVQTLHYCQGDPLQAANVLGVSLRILRAKLEDYGIETKGSADHHAMNKVVSYG